MSAKRPGLDREKRLLAELSRAVGDVFTSVEELRCATLSIARGVRPSGRQLRRSDLLGLRPAVADALARHAGFVAGAGVVLASDALADAQLWIEWFWLNSQAAPERLEVDLDPNSAEFYDYTTTEWFREPQRTAEAHIAGPYVDYICTHEYTFTLSAPLIDRGRFLGIAGADILASEVERLAVPGLARLPRVAAIANGSGRVISSNSPKLMPGMVLKPNRAQAAMRPVVTADDLPWRSRLPWVLLVQTA
ncbi:MAG: cache domain-containing protein [Solirubrobacteraceae bacterium]